MALVLTEPLLCLLQHSDVETITVAHRLFSGLLVPPFLLPLVSWRTSYFSNTMLMKPTERAPTAALMMAELATQAGLPPGVTNVVRRADP